jgi:hypothetical protein
MRTSGTYNGRAHGGTCSAAKHGLIYVYTHVLTHGGPPADGGHPGGRRTGGRADTPAGSGQGGALHYGWACMLTLWGKGGYGGSPNVEAGKVCQHRFSFSPPLPLSRFSLCRLFAHASHTHQSPCPCFKVGPRGSQDLRRRTEITPVKKYSCTRIK